MSTQFVKIDAKALDKVAQGMRRASKETTMLVERFIEGSNAVLAKNTLKDDPVPYDTGILLSSFRFQKLTPFKARWWPTAHYAHWVDQGTSKMRPRRYMEKIVKKAQPEINQLAKKLGDRVSEILTKKV